MPARKTSASSALDLMPLQFADLGNPQAVPVRGQDRGCVAAARWGRFRARGHQMFDLGRSQAFPRTGKCGRYERKRGAMRVIQRFKPPRRPVEVAMWRRENNHPRDGGRGGRGISCGRSMVGGLEGRVGPRSGRRRYAERDVL
jgi:hypothetical protein